MDRVFVYPGALPRSADILQINKNALYGIGHLAKAAIGAPVAVSGLAISAMGTPSLNVIIGDGSIYTQATVDSSAYGSLGTDSNSLVKQGLLAAPIQLAITPPATSGYSQVYLVQVTYNDTDSGATVLPYYNSANPAVPYAGPNNAGTSQYTARQGVCVVSLKAGVAAPTGSQVTPSADSGYTGLYAITVANGQTQITSANWTTLSTAPFIIPLSQVPTLAQLDARYPRIQLPPSGNTFYVNGATGNDSNNGQSASTPFATIQGAINNIRANYLCPGTVTVNVAAGTYQGFSIGSSFVSDWSFVGSGVSSCFITASTVGVNQGRGVVAWNAVVAISGMSFSSYYENVFASRSNISLTNVNGTGSSASAFIGSYNGSFVGLAGSCTISGSYSNFAAAQNSSQAVIGYYDLASTNSAAITLSGTPSFSGSFVLSNYGSRVQVYPTVTTFTGSATGSRYAANTNGIIDSQGSGAFYFPGSTAGSTSTGGQYV